MAKAGKRPKLTLKAAKAIAIKEFGTAAGLTATDYVDFNIVQSYEMSIGKYNAVISTAYQPNGIVYVSFAGNYTFYDMNTLEENTKLIENRIRQNRLEDLRDMATCDHDLMLKALIEEHGLESCRNMLEEAGGRL